MPGSRMSRARGRPQTANSTTVRCCCRGGDTVYIGPKWTGVGTPLSAVWSRYNLQFPPPLLRGHRITFDVSGIIAFQLIIICASAIPSDPHPIQTDRTLPHERNLISVSPRKC